MRSQTYKKIVFINHPIKKKSIGKFYAPGTGIVTDILRKQGTGSEVSAAATAVGQYVTAAVLNYTLFIVHYSLSLAHRFHKFEGILRITVSVDLVRECLRKHRTSHINRALHAVLFQEDNGLFH